MFVGVNKRIIFLANHFLIVPLFYQKEYKVNQFFAAYPV